MCSRCTAVSKIDPVCVNRAQLGNQGELPLVSVSDEDICLFQAKSLPAVFALWSLAAERTGIWRAARPYNLAMKWFRDAKLRADSLTKRRFRRQYSANTGSAFEVRAHAHALPLPPPLIFSFLLLATTGSILLNWYPSDNGSVTV